MKKIMFNDQYGLTEAVLSGGKTQTRRIIPKSFFSLTCNERNDTLVFENDFGDWIDIRHSVFAKYKVGEEVAVAQSYKDAGFKKGYYRDEDTLIPIFRGDDTKNDISVTPSGWTNKMFVQADIMPHAIRITNVRVERLQDISDEDCIKEGIRFCDFFNFYYYENRDFAYRHNTPREAYAALIDKISGKGTWESNPYVFVYDFELLS